MLNGLDITVLGDPHLGRSFINGVPLHRRGEREQMIRDEFAESLLNCSTGFHICMGDLFDKPIVPYTVVYFAAHTYIEATKTNPLVTYVVLQGNHDVSRDLERRSAFDLFAMIVSEYPNIIVVREPQSFGGLQFYPWHPLSTSNELVINEPAEAAFGHWDLEGESHNLIPTKAFAELGITEVYTGHIHQKQEMVRDGINVHVVGSMQPYAHGEGDLYVTKSLKEVLDSPDDYKDKCLRIALLEGEVLDQEIDCLQLTILRPDSTITDQAVEFGDFNMVDLFSQAFDTEGVPDDIRAQILDKFNCGSL